MLTSKLSKGDTAFDVQDIERIDIQGLIANRRDEIRAFADALKNSELIKFVSSKDGDETFTDLISLAVNDYGVSRKELAESVEANVATVGGWCSGRSVPAPYARKPVLDAISSIIEHDLAISA